MKTYSRSPYQFSYTLPDGREGGITLNVPVVPDADIRNSKSDLLYFLTAGLPFLPPGVGVPLVFILAATESEDVVQAILQYVNEQHLMHGIRSGTNAETQNAAN